MARIWLNFIKDLEKNLDEKRCSIIGVVTEKIGKRIIIEDRTGNCEVILPKIDLSSEINEGDIVKVIGVHLLKEGKIVVKAYVVRKLDKSEFDGRIYEELVSFFSSKGREV